jgi:ABC-type transport system involved in multi-copper enzyme maturation permease subunit
MTASELAPTLDVSGTPDIPFMRLVRVELRKMADTRAGFWLLFTVAAVTVVAIGAVFIWGDGTDRTFLDLLAFGGFPQTILLPILGILLITQEWSQRTALVTFTHEPARGRVLAAKVVAAVVFVFAALAVAAAVAGVLAPFGGADDPWDDLSVGLMARICLALTIGILWGLAFGAALLNSAFAIVAYFFAPVVVSIVTDIWTAAQDRLLWFDLGTTQGMLFESADGLSGKEWAQLGTGFLIWVVVPGVFGTWRILHAEVK